MNGREAVKALMDGKRIIREGGEFIYGLAGKSIRNQHGETFSMETVLGRDDWELHEEPLTDEQLVQQWMFMAQQTAIAAGFTGNRCSNTYEECARQLRERKL